MEGDVIRRLRQCALLYYGSSDTKRITNIQAARVASDGLFCKRHFHLSMFPKGLIFPPQREKAVENILFVFGPYTGIKARKG